MKIIEHIDKSKGTLFSFEIIPPKKGENIQDLFDHIDPLMEFKPPFIDVTYHREEYVYKKHPNGLLEKKSIKKRAGTVGICAAIQGRYKVDAVPHLICGGFTKEETENALIDLNFLGIDNILALRGDPIKTEPGFVADPEGHAYATDLIQQIQDMNQGNYLDEEVQNAVPTKFCIGAAAYPEKHFEAPNMKFDIEWLKKKVDLGAEYVVTQMFFDNKRYFDFVDKCRNEGVTIPIIPGLKPITTKNHLTILPKIFNLDLPDNLVDEVQKCKNNNEVREVGVAWGVEQSKELMEAGVPVLHYYSMGKSDSVYRIAKELF